MKKRLISLMLVIVMLCGMLPVTASAASVSGNVVDITDYNMMFGVQTAYTLKSFAVYEQGTLAEVPIVSATENGQTIDVVLAEGAPSAIQVGFSGSSDKGLILSHSNQQGTLTDGRGTIKPTLSVTIPIQQRPTISVNYTINFTVEGASGGGEEAPATLEFTTDLSTTEARYVKDAEATALTVEATHSKGAEVSYQWYKNTENSTEMAEEEPAGTPGTELTVGEDNYGYTTIDLIDRTLGSGTVQGFTVYLQSTYAKVNVDSATQDDTDIYIVLREDTDPAAKLQFGFTGTGISALSYTKQCTLSNGSATVNLDVKEMGQPKGTYTIYFTVAGMGGEEPTGATAIEGATSASYTPSTAEYGTLYYFVVASAEGVEPVTSSIAMVTVSEPSISFTTDLNTAEVQYIKNAAATPLTVEATQSEGAAVTYQWYKNTENNTTSGTAIEGATSATYTPLTGDYGTVYYYVIATDGEISKASSVAKITVLDPYITFGTDLATAQVSYLRKDDNSAVTALTVAATQSEGAEVSYQWYKNTANNTTSGTLIEGATAATYTPAIDTVGTTYYYVVATDGEISKASSVAKIVVNLPTITFSDNLSASDDALYLVGTESEGITALTVEATQSEEAKVSYQWYKNTENNTTGGTPIDGATSAAYTPAASEEGVTYYYVVAATDVGTADEVTKTSATAKVTVREMGVEFTTDLNTTAIEKYTGEEVTLTVAAKPTIPDAMYDWESKLTYQWYSNTVSSTEGGTRIEGATSASYKPATDKVGTTYYYVVVTLDGTYTATSSVATVKLNLAPTVVYKHSIHANGTYWGGNGDAYLDTLTVSGVKVDSFAWDGDTGTIMLSPDTPKDAEVTFSFTIGGTWTAQYKAATINGNDVKNAKRGTVTLENGEAVAAIRVEGWRNVGRTKTINISLTPVDPPDCLVERDSVVVYPGFESTLDIAEYFSDADTYYLVDGESKTPIDGHVYSFTPASAGTYTYVFAASNKLGGMCDDYVTVTATASDVENGIWIRHITSNGSLDSVAFTDENGEAIEGISITRDGTTITVTLPRSFEMGSKVKATFALTQNNGLPFVSGSTAFNQGIGNTTAYVSTISSGVTTKAIYLYNSEPGATSNNYTTYTLKYVIANEAPVLADEQAATGEASITADQTYTLDLDGIFIDPDTGDADPDRVAGWKVSVNGAASSKAIVDEENVYSFSTDEKGEYTLVFTAVDTYNAESTDTYTVTLNVDNAATTYTVSVAVPAGIEPTFYYTEAAEEDTELTAQKNANSYTVTVPTNISVISWRADGMGMSAEVSEENNTLDLVKTDYVVKAGEKVDSGATVTVKYGSKSALGSNNSFLLLSTESYTVKAVPSDDYIKNWKAAELKTQSAVDGECVIQLITREIIFTVPCYAELTVAPASSRQGVKPIALEPVKTDGPDYATDTQNYYYELSNGTVYEYRVSVPESHQNADEYVTYVGVFTKTDNTTAITVTEDQIMDGDNGRETIDHVLTPRTDKETLDMANVADLYLNINAQGYLKLEQGQTRDVLAARTWWATNGGGWAMFTYYFVEPEYTYTVVGLDGKPSTDVISIDERGVITAKGNGTAIVLVSYDAMNVDFEDALYTGCETPTPDGFYGAIWPENTGVFVVSVGAGDSGISTGLTINEDKPRTNKAAGSAIDSEHDVIYFVGSSGAYSFTPGTEGVTVSVANPTIADNVLGFSGFTVLAAEEDGSYTVPLTNGRNIVRIEKDGKAEYQVITAKSVKVSVNGQSLDEVVVAPGSKISVKFDTLYNPVNRMALYNSAAATVYSEISGWDGKTAGGYRGGVGYYFFASSDFCQTVDHFNSAGTDGSSYGNNAISWGDLLTVPEDFSEAEFTLSDGAFSVGGFSKFNFGDHRTAMGQAPSTGGADNIIAFFGRLPDISIPVGTAKGISVTKDPDRLEYNIGDVFDPSGMEVSVVFELADGSEKTRTVTGFTYDTAAFTESGEQSVNISYGGSTASIKVKVSEKELHKIELTANPSKTNYYIGEAFETGGMEVSATYSDGSEETTAIITNYTVSPEVIAKDTSEITISYGSKTCSVPVTVILIESIAVTTAPNKLQYTVGESFDPAGMVVTANYTDGSVYTTTEYDYTPAGELTLADTSISIIYNGDDGVEGLAPASVAITVTAKPDDGEQGDNTPTTPEYDSIVVYMSFVDEGKVIVNDKRITVYDKNRDGKYTIGDAFRALHREYYTYGESGYAEISNATLSGWVSKFWGKSTPTFSYAYNNGWAGSTNQTIKAGDSIAAFNGEDYVFYSDLYTWFDSRNYTVYTDTDNSFTVNGINIMGSNAGTGARYAPAGADVKVYKGGKEVAELGTSVGEDGSFIINFSETGVYTVKVSGTAHYADYREAPVVPCSCTVTVKKAPAQEEKPDDGGKPDEETIPDSGFEDISGHWGKDAIDYVAYKGIMNGVSEKCFEPNGEVSRAMVATVIYRLAGSPEYEGENIFTDVPKGKWYTDAVIWAAENGIVKGYGDGVFAPEKSIARQEMAAMLMRYASYKGMDTESDADLSAYTDSGEIGAWALDAMRWANENGLITGRSGSILAPKDTATRAEMAKILMCFMTMDSYEAE